MEELRNLLRRDAFVALRPFGMAITLSLRNARLQQDGSAVWEEEDYCTPPLAQERAAVLDTFFESLETELVGSRQSVSGRGARNPRATSHISRATRSAVSRDCNTQSFRAIPR
jgi:hypothetical protein